MRAARVGEHSAVENTRLYRSPCWAMLSMVGVGMTPPNVLGTPKPASSVMIIRTFGAPFGGTMRGAHQNLDCRASSLMTPPNCGSGAGSCLPVIVVVALGEPGTPVTVCADAPKERIAKVDDAINRGQKLFMMAIPPVFSNRACNGTPSVPAFAKLQKLSDYWC